MIPLLFLLYCNYVTWEEEFNETGDFYTKNKRRGFTSKDGTIVEQQGTITEQQKIIAEQKAALEAKEAEIKRLMENQNNA